MQTFFEEEVYTIKEEVALVLPHPFSELQTEAKAMLQNLANALKLTPAPRIVCLTEEELRSLASLPPFMVLFGHQLTEVKAHLPASFRSSRVTLTEKASVLAGDAEAKKELWAAIRLMLSRQD